MATGINMSIYGLYYYNPNIFDDMALPAEVNRDDLIAGIMLECAELTALYPDANMMKEAVKYWSNTRLHVWERMALVLYNDYDPFINIKRDEVRTITQSRDLQSEGLAVDSVNAWSTTNPTEQARTKTDGAQTGTVTTQENFHVEGDSAITDAQDVAKKEIELRNKYELYNYIINDFKMKFCLQIY